jgi:hypothetical protein
MFTETEKARMITELEKERVKLLEKIHTKIL